MVENYGQMMTLMDEGNKVITGRNDMDLSAESHRLVRLPQRI